jgi:hypothetical protein
VNTERQFSVDHTAGEFFSCLLEPLVAGNRQVLYHRLTWIVMGIPATLGRETRLDLLRRDFLATSTQSMPIAGMVFWLAAAVASRILTPAGLAYFVGFGSGTVFPLGLMIDRLRGRPMLQGGSTNPVALMFMQCLAIVALL